MVKKRFKKVGNYLDYTSTGMQRVLDNLDRIENKEKELQMQNAELFGGNSMGDISIGKSKGKKNKAFGDCSNYDSGGF